MAEGNVFPLEDLVFCSIPARKHGICKRLLHGGWLAPSANLQIRKFSATSLPKTCYLQVLCNPSRTEAFAMLRLRHGGFSAIAPPKFWNHNMAEGVANLSCHPCFRSSEPRTQTGRAILALFFTIHDINLTKI